MTPFIITSLVLGGIVAIVSFWFMGTFNKLVHLKAMVDEAWSGIDVQLKRRYDLIPNLVETVKHYAAHEKGIFEEIARMRAASMNASGVEQRAHAEQGLTRALRRLFVVVENYPTLKANESFLSLQNQLTVLEHEIQLSRRYYNGTARNYNILVKSFPSRIVANLSSFDAVPYFELTSSEEREVPRVQF